MYIQHIPHPLAHFSREFDSGATLVVAQTTSTNATNFPSLSQPKSHRTWYIVIGIVLVVLLLSIVGFFIAHRRVRTLLPCTVKRPKRNEKQESAPHMQRTGRTRFTDEFNIIPSLNDRKGSASSRTPTSPSIEGPSTPVNGDIGLKSVKDECSYVPIPIIVHSPRQTHQTTFLTGPDDSSLDFIAPTADHGDFFDKDLPMDIHGSSIRPHGLPLSPVPEESSTAVWSPHIVL